MRREQEVRKWRQGQEGFVSGSVTERMRGGEKVIALKIGSGRHSNEGSGDEERL